MNTTNKPSARRPGAAICFGLDRATDEQSLAACIERFARTSLLAALVPRLSDEEITATLDFLSNLMHKHLDEKEYHQLFLTDDPM